MMNRKWILLSPKGYYDDVVTLLYAPYSSLNSFADTHMICSQEGL